MVDAQYHHKATRAVHSFCLAKTQERIVFRWGVDAQLWSVAACCRFAVSQLAGWELCSRVKFPEQARGEKSGSKLPHSKAAHARSKCRRVDLGERGGKNNRCPTEDGMYVCRPSICRTDAHASSVRHQR
jgi:hypothetical protein